MKRQRVWIVAAILMLTAALLLSGCGDGASQQQPRGEASIEDIAVKTNPKTDYVLGDDFSIQGGELTLYYDDGTTKTLAFTEDGVHVSAPDMGTVGSKTVTVEYDGFTASYMITLETKKVQVTLDLNYEGAPAAEKLSVEEGALAARPADPSREDYRFLGWYADPACETEFDFSATAITENITVYASWIGVASITFNYNYPDAPEAVTIQTETGSALQEGQAPAAAREGFVFAGWHTDAEADSSYDFATAVEESQTLYAHWTELSEGATQVAVTFDYNGAAGFPARTVNVEAGTAVEKPQDPEAKGRSFTGWYKDAEGTEEFDFEKPVDADMTLYAGWNVQYYQVSFTYVINGEETVLRTRKIEPGDKASAGSVPVVEGYRFVNEWFTDPEYTTPYDFSQEVKRDLTLYIRPLKENRFEAEYTRIDDTKTGVGSSDNFSGLKLIFVDNGTANASNGFWVSGLYYNTAFLEFPVYAASDVTNALLQLRLSAEWADMYIAPENMSFNGQEYYKFEISAAPAQLDEATGEVLKDAKGYALYKEEEVQTFPYSPIAITGAITFAESMVDKRPFTDYMLTDSFSLKEGWNVIRLTVANNHAAYDGTMEATAPMIDALSIFTDTELSWEPHTENVEDVSKLNN